MTFKPIYFDKPIISFTLSFILHNSLINSLMYTAVNDIKHIQSKHKVIA